MECAQKSALRSLSALTAVISDGDLLMPRTRTTIYGPCNFAVSGPCASESST